METLADNLEEVSKEGVFLIHFEAKWCEPCKKVNQELKSLEKDFPEVGFAKVDVDSSTLSTRKYVIVSVPTILILRDGEEIERFVGNVSSELVRLELALRLGRHLEELS